MRDSDFRFGPKIRSKSDMMAGQENRAVRSAMQLLPKIAEELDDEFTEQDFRDTFLAYAITSAGERSRNTRLVAGLKWLIGEGFIDKEGDILSISPKGEDHLASLDV